MAPSSQDADAGRPPLSSPDPPLLRVRLAGPEATALVAVCRSRVLKHVDDGGQADKELSEAARELEGYDEGQAEVSVAQVKAVGTVLRKLASSASESGEEALTNTLMKGARLAFPRHERRKAEALAQAKAKEGWRAELVARSQQREYDRMVKNVHWGGPKNPEAETRPLYQASIAFNMLAAMATAGFLGYYVAGSIHLQTTHRLMVGVVCAMGMMVIEMVLYIIRATELERYQPKRARNEELGRRGLPIPVGDIVDDVKLLRQQHQRPRVTSPPATTAPKDEERKKLL